MKIDTITVNKIAENIAESSPAADLSSNLLRAVPQKVIAHALNLAFNRFAHEYPALVSVINSGIGANLLSSELSKLMAGQEKPDPNSIAKIWEKLLLEATNKLEISDKEFSELENAATTFIEYVRNELAKEISDYSHSIEIEPKAKSYFERGMANYYAGNLTAALVDFDLALRLDPSYAQAIAGKDRAIQALTESTQNTHSHFIIESANSNIELTPENLTQKVAPYLIAIGDMQAIIDNIFGRQHNKVLIKSITQNSPIGISLDGVSETIQLIVDYVVPTKRKHAEIMAEYARREKQYEIEKKRIEIQEINFNSIKNKQELEKLSVEIEKMRAEAEKVRIDNEKARLELAGLKINLASDILAKVAPNLPETEKLTHLFRLLPVIETIVSSDIEIRTEKLR